MKIMRNAIMGLTLAATLGLSAATTHAATITTFEEHFNYADSNALKAAWTLVNGQSNYFYLGTDPANDPTQPYAVFGNGLVSRPLSSTMTSDWTVSFRLTNPVNQRGAWVGLFDSTGEHGYAVLWDTGNPVGGGGNGVVSIRKFNLTGPLDTWTSGVNTAWQNNGVPISSNVDTGHLITSTTMAQFTLSWTKATGTLTVTVDGVTKLTLTDTAFSSFSKIYIKGQPTQFYDDVVVTTVPEPASMGLMMLGGCLLAMRR